MTEQTLEDATESAELTRREQSMIERYRTTAMEVATSRAAQEVQAAMTVAQKFPRDETDALARIVRACQRYSLAANSMYDYSRGGTRINAPNIRLAETLIRCWGNAEAGVIELDRRRGESTVMAFAWDLETNTRDVKVFAVPHLRAKKIDGVLHAIRLTDPRDIYEHCANYAARRKRACILAIIPADIVEHAVKICEATMEMGDGTPLADRIRNMVIAFSEYGVTKEQLEKRLNHKIESTSATELVKMGNILVSIRDNMAPVEEWFPSDKPQEQPKTGDARATEIAKQQQKKKRGRPKKQSASAAQAEQAQGVRADSGQASNRPSADEKAEIEAQEAREMGYEQKDPADLFEDERERGDRSNH